MKIVSLVFVLSCLIFSVTAGAITIKPDNVGVAGGTFSFDLVIHDPAGADAMSFDTTINVSGPGTLTFDETGSEAVAGNSGYWIYDNSLGAVAKSIGSNEYSFGDTADNPISELLLADEIVARYAFAWDGTAGDYTFSLDLTDTDKNSAFLSDFSTELLQFTPGDFSGTSESFTVTIPEPATIMLLSLGGTALLRNRKRTT